MIIDFVEHVSTIGHTGGMVEPLECHIEVSLEEIFEDYLLTMEEFSGVVGVVELAEFLGFNPHRTMVEECAS